MNLVRKFKQLNIEMKYVIRTIVIEKYLNQLPTCETIKLLDCVKNGVSYWEHEISDYVKVNDDKFTETERTIQLNRFNNYLTINILYALLMCQKSSISINNQIIPQSLLREAVIDSNIEKEYIPINTHMKISKDKVMLNGMLYYDARQNNEENTQCKEDAANYAKTKRLNTLTDFMSAK